MVSVVCSMRFISVGRPKIKLRLPLTFRMNGIAFAEPSFHVRHVDKVTEVVWFSLVADPYWFLLLFIHLKKSRLIVYNLVLNANC